MLTQTQNNI